MSSGWFDHTEPSLSGVQGAYALVRDVSSTSNLVEPSRTTLPGNAGHYKKTHLDDQIRLDVEKCMDSNGGN